MKDKQWLQCAVCDICRAVRVFCGPRAHRLNKIQPCPIHAVPPLTSPTTLVMSYALQPLILVLRIITVGYLKVEI